MNHRKVPIPFTDAPRGQCRWCGENICDEDGVINKRRRWHPICVDEYRLLSEPRRNWWANGQKTEECPKCQTPWREVPRRPDSPFVILSEVEIDHIIPLIDGGSHGIENLQALCWICHKTKTRMENRSRRATAQSIQTKSADH